MSKLPNPCTVANSFVKQYYHLLAHDPDSLHRFYKDESCFSRCEGSQMEYAISGQKAIHDMILKIGYRNAHVDIEAGSVDSHASHDGGVIVMVTGLLTLEKYKVPRPFVQTFFLATQPKGFYVLNDIFRFLDVNSLLKVPVAAPVQAVEMKHVMTSPRVMSPVAKPQSPVVRSNKPMSPMKTPPMTSPKVKSPSPVKSPPPKEAEEEEIAVEESSEYTATVEYTEEKEEEQEKNVPSSRVTWAAKLFSGSNPMPMSTAPAPVSASSHPVRKAPSSQPRSTTTATTGAFPRQMSNKTTEKIRPPNQGASSLYITNLPAELTEKDLYALFEQYGTIVNVNLNFQRNYAFIDFAQVASMKKAVSDQREFMIHGTTLHVEERNAEKKQSNRGNNMRGRNNIGGFRGNKPSRNESGEKEKKTSKQRSGKNDRSSSASS